MKKFVASVACLALILTATVTVKAASVDEIMPLVSVSVCPDCGGDVRHNITSKKETRRDYPLCKHGRENGVDEYIVYAVTDNLACMKCPYTDVQRYDVREYFECRGW